MVLRRKLTPETFLAAPRRSAAVPSPSGRLAYFTQTSHVFPTSCSAGPSATTTTKTTTTTELMLLDLGTGEHWPLTAATTPAAAAGGTAHVPNLGDVSWIPGTIHSRLARQPDELLWLRPATGPDALPGATEIVVVTAPTAPDALPVVPYVAGVVPAPIHALQLKALPDGTVALAGAGLVSRDGSLYNEKTKTSVVAAAASAFSEQEVGIAGSGGAGTTAPSLQTPDSTARIYDTWHVREGDDYLRPQPYAIWYNNLVWRKCKVGPDDKSNEADGKAAAPAVAATTYHWALAGPLHNALQHADPLLEAPVGLCGFDGDADVSMDAGADADTDAVDTATNVFDIGPPGIVFVARLPAPTDPVRAACTDVYYVPLDSFADAPRHRPTRITISLSPQAPMFATASTPPPHGVCRNPRFSPDGTMLAFLRAPLAQPADARLHMGHLVAGAAFDVVSVVVAVPVGVPLGNNASSRAGDDGWPTPDSFTFAPSGQAMLFTAANCGRRSVFVLELRAGARPRCVSQLGSVAAYHLLRRQRGRPGEDNDGPFDHIDDALSSYALLVSGSSFVESRFYHIVDLDGADGLGFFEPRVVATASKDGARFGLSYAKQVAEIYFEGGGSGGHGDGDGEEDDDDNNNNNNNHNYPAWVQAWVVKPSDFIDDGRRYPLAVLLHDGPVGAWWDAWHPQWNAALWAEQGYVVVLPNLAGSVGFGREHAARTYGGWGGVAYGDLVHCMAALKQMPFLDCSRAVVAGAGYGGYLVNWMHGSSLAKEFTAAVVHGGVFSTAHLALTADTAGNRALCPGLAVPWANLAGGSSNNTIATTATAGNRTSQRWDPACPERLAQWPTHAPPTLVVHGGCDSRYAVTEGLAAFRALQARGVASRFLAFPDEGRAVRGAANALVYHRVVFEWVNRWARNAASE